ncbi:hypothetical protein FOZ63_002666 [Perkinsus olseni]|uniref:Uncharacterized protein n=1 Tax=Perkinsus olseni TaxID=32597 RepID=A0A7J6NET0_PEROL|nr:hypothetical protein FOZ60_010789 [Perkinsus olseni]KAF4723118.1 hypothetical protein FOZ63_002666 [Perkinsus olseni]
MNFVSAWLLSAQVLTICTAPDVGRFRYQGPFFSLYYDVDEDKKVTHRVEVPKPKYDTRDIPTGQHYVRGPYALRKVTNFTYTIDFEASGITSAYWQQSVENFLRSTGVLESDETYYPGDLATLHYTGGDELFVNLGGEEIHLMRVGRRLVPGEYVYKESVPPYISISYKIYAGGLGGVMVESELRATSRFAHKLSRRESGLQYSYYAVESAGQGSLKQFLDQVRYVWPGKRVFPDDFSRVVVATENTIYVEVEGGRLALTKV